MKIALSLVLGTTFAVTGCIADREYQDPFGALDDGFADDNFDEGLGDELNIRNSRISGDIGNVRGFDAAGDDDSYGNVDTEWRSTNVTLTAYDTSGRMGMLILNVDGEDIRNVAPGRYVFNQNTYEPVLGEGYVSIMGCSEDSSAFYDQPATEGEIVIAEGPQGREIDVQAELPSDIDPSVTTSAQGSFVLAR